MGKKDKRKDKERATRHHKQQVSLLSLSADSRVPLDKRREALLLLKPKYFIRAMDETLELKFMSEQSRQKLLDVREKIKNNEITVSEAMFLLEQRDEKDNF